MSSQALMARRFGPESIVLVTVFVAVTAVTAVFVYPAFGWDPGGVPQPARSVLLALTIVFLVKLSGAGVGSLGLSRPKMIWLAILLAFAFIVFKLFAVQPFMDTVKDFLNVPRTDYAFLANIEGNVPVYLGWVAIAWIAGGFAEEVIFRGYLMTRFAAVAGGGALAWVFAVFAQAVLFGLGHFYQGYGAMISIGIGAVISGLFFLLVGRNLWSLILAHGAWDTLGMTIFFLEGVPTSG